ncbi:polyprenyl synthetase family protein [Streptomyces sp. NPDC051211]|uniref:polyprenyl synthetase family protein n=1 Tax=Streptomyces sp. NPDC051211 TaxID=3154643 RepID=UPI00344BA0DD
MLSVRSVGAPERFAAIAGTAVELVHQLSLLHDDVMDGDTERRGKTAAWARFGTGAAVLAGDALVVQAVATVVRAQAPGARAATEDLVVAVEQMVDGQAEDLALEGRPLGVGTDLLREKTLPLVLAAQSPTAEGRQVADLLAAAPVAPAAVPEVMGLLEATGSREQAEEAAGRYVASALSALDEGVPENPAAMARTRRLPFPPQTMTATAPYEPAPRSAYEEETDGAAPCVRPARAPRPQGLPVASCAAGRLALP